MRLQEIAPLGQISVVRDAAFQTVGLLSDPQPQMLTFVEEERYVSRARRIPGVVCITNPRLAPHLDGVAGLAVAADPRRALFDYHNYLARHTDFYWTDFPTAIDGSARVHARAYVAEKNVRIGANTVIEPNATILERCVIGSGVRIRAGTVLGSVGLQAFRFGDAVVDMIHAGGVRIGDGVEIFANAVVASAIFRQFTTIGAECRIGNLAFISHNAELGPRCFVGHGAVINGFVKIGANARIGPGSTLTHCIHIGEAAHVSLGSVVIGDVAPGQHVTGNVAVEHYRFMRHAASVARPG